jgi:phosphoadenosine phosphosulfate reductase
MKNSTLSAADNALLAPYPRDFKKIPTLTQYGTSDGDISFNKGEETARINFLTQRITHCLKTACDTHQRPMITVALIAGDIVILDALHKAGLLDKVSVVFIDTFTLFPETVAFLHELEAHYGFKAEVYNAKGIESQAEYEQKYGTDYWQKDIDAYDELCKVEPLKRAMSEKNTDCWINGRRRDHGAERASLSVCEGKKLNPLAYWTFEDCWNYLRIHNVPYHPLHDDGYSSLGDKHSTLRVDDDKWMAYAGERSGRFQGLKNKDGSVKTECGLHSKNRPAKKARLSTNDMSASSSPTPELTKA